VPEEHSKKSNHNSAKDKTPRVANTSLVVVGSQPVGIAHAKLLGRPTGADIVVNATCIGLYPDIDGRLNLDVKSLRPSLIVADVIPNPPRTRLVRDAEARGCRVLDGLGMIVNQGIIGIKYWTIGPASMLKPL
jgi:shikimate 5-dehydrogenase